ncbi:hypothetical protein GC207_08480 [bacterium]|nr:hypothetical protein [bacterium]
MIRPTTNFARLRFALIAGAVILAFLAFVARPDSFEEMDEGIQFSWTALGATWAALAFVACHGIFGQGRHIKTVAICCALLTWLIIGFAFSSWQRHKVHLRLGSRFPELYQKHVSEKSSRSIR